MGLLRAGAALKDEWAISNITKRHGCARQSCAPFASSRGSKTISRKWQCRKSPHRTHNCPHKATPGIELWPLLG
jgi:hypothetical protein